MTLIGENLGWDVSANVQVGSFKCNIIEAAILSHNKLICQLPDGAGKHLDVTYSVAGQSGILSNGFSFNPPTIKSISPKYGSTEGGDIITLQGADFGPKNPEITIGNVLCSFDELTMLHSHNSTECLLPEGSGSNLSVKIVVADQEDIVEDGFSYDAPEIQLVSPSSTNTQGKSIYHISLGYIG